ncbi:hypothetical protein JCM19052_2275 [Vibrio sp. JCM 19052]|nr:hypothetical protein JCM19052_2275 [Vibrio sp. JCM 19052]
MEEIVQWKDKSDAQRDAIIEQLVGNDSTTLVLSVARSALRYCCGERDVLVL